MPTNFVNDMYVSGIKTMSVISTGGFDSPESSQSSELNATVCLLCRQRKTRCDRKLPKCGNCRKGKLDCFYVKAQKKPGLRAGYVSELEHRIKVLEHDVLMLKSQSLAPPLPRIENGPLSTQRPTASLTSTFADGKLLFSRDTDRSLSTDLLSPRVLPKLLEMWFTIYHFWFPILHQASFISTMVTHLEDPSLDQIVIFKAIASVTSLSNRSIILDINGLAEDEVRATSQRLHDEVLIHATEKLSLRSLQAVLILSLADLSLGKLSTFWNVVALAKSMGTQLGLRDLVVNYGQNYNQPSILAPRMLPLPQTMIDREERIRAYWMIESLDASSTLGAAWNISLLSSFPTQLLPCSDDAWEYSEPSVWSPIPEDEPQQSFSFSTYVSLVTKDLLRVHNAMQEPYDLSWQSEKERWLQNCNEVYQELCDWRSTSLGNPLATHGFDVDGSLKFDVNIISANVALDSSIVAMYQKQALENAEPNLAQDRCIQSSNNIAALQSVLMNKMQLLGPNNVFGLFVAARFMLVYSDVLRKPLKANTQALLGMFKEYAAHWQLAAILQKVLSTAEQDHGRELSSKSLPLQFYDLKYSALDIYEALRIWSCATEPPAPHSRVLPVAGNRISPFVDVRLREGQLS